MTAPPNKPPRDGESATCRGAYSLACRLSADIVNPGEALEIEVYITGYGEIGPAKLVFYPSSDAFDLAKSKIRFGFGSENGMCFWGGQQIDIDPVGTTLDLSGGMKQEGWAAPTLFFDSPASVQKAGRLPQLITESKQRYAPVHISLSVSKMHGQG